jgi:Tol biopolymer transport system component
MTADGRNTLLLTKSIMMGTPSWSPDGQALAVATREENKMGIAILTGIQPYKDRLMNPKPINVFQRTP